MNKQMLNTYFEDKPEMTAKVSKSLKMTLTLDTSCAHHPSVSLGETFALKLVRQNTCSPKSDLVNPSGGVFQSCLHTKKTPIN